jgi:hypothetical protein
MLVKVKVDSVATYFITLHKPITQFVEGSPCSHRLIVLASFSTSKLNKNSESIHCSVLRKHISSHNIETT